MHCYLAVFLGLFEPFRRDLTRSKGGLHLEKWVTLGKKGHSSYKGTILILCDRYFIIAKTHALFISTQAHAI